MAQMSTDELHAFLMRGTRTGKLATVRADGRPHIAPVWFVLDGDDIVFMTGADTVKGRNLQRDPRAAVSVDDEQPPYAFALLEGVATLDGDLDEMYRWALPISARYMGDDQAERYARRNAVAGELLVRLTPTKVVAQGDVAG